MEDTNTMENLKIWKEELKNGNYGKDGDIVVNGPVCPWDNDPDWPMRLLESERMKGTICR